MINKQYFVLGGFIVLSINLVWLLLGQDSYVLIHDNLDGEFVYIIHLLKSCNVLGIDLDGQIEGVMNGVNRSYFRSGLNITILLFYLFPPFVAYVVNHALVHFIGFAGMYYLLKKYFVKENDILVLIISLTFGLLSYYHIQYGLSISGQPLLLFAFLNILNNEKKFYNWLIILAFPFYSFLPVTLPFFLPFLFLIAGITYYNKRKISVQFITALCMLVIVNLLVEFNLVYSSFFSTDVMHRTEFNRGRPDFSAFIEQLASSLLYTQYHAGKLFISPVIGVVFLCIFLNRKLQKSSIRLLYTLFIVLILTLAGRYITYYFGDQINLLKTIQVDRFYFLAPMLWLLLFASVLNELDWRKHIQKYFAISFLIIVSGGALRLNPELSHNINFLLNNRSMPSFRQFFDKELFNKIKGYIDIEANNSDYHVISIGMHPSIAQYNNLNSLDSYQNNYSLAYKHKFRNIIAKEISKTSELKEYYDNWGSLCYAFSSNLGKDYMFSKNSNLTIPVPDYDWNAFKAMNGKFVLSPVQLNLVGNEGITFLKSFESQHSFWKIWLYKVN